MLLTKFLLIFLELLQPEGCFGTRRLQIFCKIILAQTAGMYNNNLACKRSLLVDTDKNLLVLVLQQVD